MEQRLALVRQRGQHRRGNLVETLYGARAQAFYVPQDVYLLAGRASRGRAARAHAVALEARISLTSGDDRRAFLRDWRRLTDKYAPRRDGGRRDAIFEAIALCVPAEVGGGNGGRGRRNGRR